MVNVKLHLAVMIIVVSSAIASPARADEARAKKLFLAATKKYDKGDYKGALIQFKRAYDAFPRAKILLNIGATYLKLGNRAEAANYLERFIGHEGAEAKQVKRARAELADLDGKLAKLKLDVQVTGGTVSVDGGAVGESPLELLMRVEPGHHEVRVVVEQDGWTKKEPIEVTAGMTLGVVLVRDAASNPAPEPATAASPTARPESSASETPAVVMSAEDPRAELGRLGIYVRTDVDAAGRGAVVAPGVSFAITRHIEAFASGLAGGNYGAELGARVGIGSWKLRPVVSVAVPLFFDDGARPGARGAVGAAWSLGRFEASIDVGAAHAFSVPDNHVKTVMLASAGVGMRL